MLQEREVERLGGAAGAGRRAVLAATNPDLRGLVQARRFREDLYDRLNVVTLELPPLREPPEDIVPLTERFLRVCARGAGKRGLAARARLAARGLGVHRRARDRREEPRVPRGGSHLPGAALVSRRRVAIGLGVALVLVGVQTAWLRVVLATNAVLDFMDFGG